MSDSGAAKRSGLFGLGWPIIIGIIAVLIGLAVAAWWYFRPAPDAPFAYEFRGCDAQERCGEFELYAPGAAFAWTLEGTSFESGATSEEVIAALDGRLENSAGVIAVGLASSEGTPRANRELTSCRSRKLAEALTAANRSSGANTPIYRTALGQYNDDTTEFQNTAIQRSTVFVFIKEQDEELVLGQAIIDGLGDDLNEALQSYSRIYDLGDLGFLDFRRYDCWPEELTVSEGTVRRTRANAACYDESSPDFNC